MERQAIHSFSFSPLPRFPYTYQKRIEINKNPSTREKKERKKKKKQDKVFKNFLSDQAERDSSPVFQPAARKWQQI